MISVPWNISRATSCRAQLQRVRPAQRGAVKQLAGGFEHRGIERLLHHAG